MAGSRIKNRRGDRERDRGGGMRVEEQKGEKQKGEESQKVEREAKGWKNGRKVER
jgi:hypothetical protein